MLSVILILSLNRIDSKRNKYLSFYLLSSSKIVITDSSGIMNTPVASEDTSSALTKNCSVRSKMSSSFIGMVIANWLSVGEKVTFCIVSS